MFFKAALENERPVINGDGEHSRDFTYVDNAVEANILALFTEDVQAINQIYNVACGERTSLNELWNNINAITNTSIPAIYGPNRAGDIAHSLADITKARQLLGYSAAIKVKEGLEKSFNWYHKEF